MELYDCTEAIRSAKKNDRLPRRRLSALVSQVPSFFERDSWEAEESKKIKCQWEEARKNARANKAAFIQKVVPHYCSLRPQRPLFARPHSSV